MPDSGTLSASQRWQIAGPTSGDTELTMRNSNTHAIKASGFLTKERVASQASLVVRLSDVQGVSLTTVT